MPKEWIIEDIFLTYDLANELKKQLLHSPKGAILQVKIKRHPPNAAINTETYVVKSRIDPSLAAAVEEIEKQLLNSKNKKK
jgi:hypothetical protein